MAKLRNLKHPEIVKMVNSLSGFKSFWEVWNDVITMIATSIANSCDCNQQRKLQRENLYLDACKKYTEDEMQTVIKITAAITDELEENPNQDLLGDLFMSLDFGNNAIGQFFTPYPVCQAMVKIAFVKNEVNGKGYIRVNEPACGAGANIIALVNEMKKQDINFQNGAFIVAQDLSQITALMCYIQLSLLGCAGIVIVGDSLQSLGAKTQTEIELDNNIWLTPMYCSKIWNERRMLELFKSF